MFQWRERGRSTGNEVKGTGIDKFGMGESVQREEGEESESRIKGTVSRDFLLQAFFMNHLPPSL
jgi:hypothetical protein